MGCCHSAADYEEYLIFQGAHDAQVELHAVNGGGNGYKIQKFGSECSTSSLSDQISRKMKEEWSYGYDNGPSTWPDRYPDCCGHRQSPVDIDPEKAVKIDDENVFKMDPDTMQSIFGSTHDLLSIPDAKPHELMFHYQNGGAICTNDGKSVTICASNAGEIRIFNDEPFALIQFTFHMPSEHTISGEQFPLEMQIVHQHEGTGEIAIVSFLFSREGKKDPFLDEIMRGRPPPLTHESYRLTNVDWNLLDTSTENFVNYDGSLTQPPCTEGVAWFVSMDVLPCSGEQLLWLRKSIPFNNSRPIQDFNDRKIRRCTAQHQQNIVE